MIANRLQPVRAAFRTAATLLLITGAACGRAGLDGRPEHPEHPERLDGEWTAEFHLEHSATLTRDTTGVPVVRGTVVLLENGRVRATEGLSGAPTHYGVYAADLRPLDLHGSTQVPTLVVRLARGDSVEVAFDPEQGRPFVGRGVLAGDSISGHWWSGGSRTVPRSSGRFVMRRP